MVGTLKCLGLRRWRLDMARIKKKQRYLCQYKDNKTDEVMEYQFEAENDHHAQLIAESFCDEGWHKLYGVLRVSK